MAPSAHLVSPYPSLQRQRCVQRRLGRWCAILLSWAGICAIWRAAATAATRPPGPPLAVTGRGLANPLRAQSHQPIRPRLGATLRVETPTVPDDLTWFSASLWRGQAGVKSLRKAPQSALNPHPRSLPRPSRCGVRSQAIPPSRGSDSPSPGRQRGRRGPGPAARAAAAA